MNNSESGQLSSESQGHFQDASKKDDQFHSEEASVQKVVDREKNNDVTVVKDTTDGSFERHTTAKRSTNKNSKSMQEIETKRGDVDEDSDDSGTQSVIKKKEKRTTKASREIAQPSTSVPVTEMPKQEEIATEKFAVLSYMEVQINLRFLGDLKEGEKVMIDQGRFMQVDQRYAQAARRWWTSDSRVRSLRFISHLIESAKKYCGEAVEKIQRAESKQDNLEKLINIQSLLRNALTGLGRMITTYGDDKLNLATIETFRSTITVFCDQDLKKAIKLEDQ